MGTVRVWVDIDVELYRAVVPIASDRGLTINRMLIGLLGSVVINAREAQRRPRPARVRPTKTDRKNPVHRITVADYPRIEALMAEGRTGYAIAADLGIHLNTAYKHMSIIRSRQRQENVA